MYFLWEIYRGENCISFSFLFFFFTKIFMFFYVCLFVSYCCCFILFLTKLFMFFCHYDRVFWAVCVLRKGGCVCIVIMHSKFEIWNTKDGKKQFSNSVILQITKGVGSGKTPPAPPPSHPILAPDRIDVTRLAARGGIVLRDD